MRSVACAAGSAQVDFLVTCVSTGIHRFWPFGLIVFIFKDAPKGSQLVQIKSAGYKDQLLSVDIETGKILDLGVVVLEEDITSEQQLSLITITENDLGDDNSGSESTAGLFY